MNLGERLQKARNKGYMPVHVPSERCYFFVENSRNFKIGETIKNAIGQEYKIVNVSNKELEAEEG